MVSLALRKGYTPPAVSIETPGSRTVHHFTGHMNPRCRTCDRTPMQAQAAPFAACVPVASPVETDIAARVEICILAIERRVDATLVDQALLELGATVREARAAKLPLRAQPLAIRLAAAIRDRRRRA